MLKYLRLLLFPFSILYGLVILIRNKLYDWHLLKSTQFDLPVICVGNLVVGGSGKSPVTEYLVHLLSDYKVAILSRGYGRKTKGFFLADHNSTVVMIGDEPMQFYKKFPQVTVAVCEDRVKGIHKLKDHHDLIILDDAYQHRAVHSGYSILLFEFSRMQSLQFLLPAGNLREPFKGYKRAQSLLITKSPVNISLQEELICAAKFNLNEQDKLAFSYLEYGDLIPFNSLKNRSLTTLTEDTFIVLLTGIANPDPLLRYLNQFSKSLEHHEYPDHHQFTRKDIKKVVDVFNNHSSLDKILITTEKDVQRLLDTPLKELLLNLPVFYLPVKIDIHGKDKFTFDKRILEYVSITTRNRTVH